MTHYSKFNVNFSDFVEVDEPTTLHSILCVHIINLWSVCSAFV